MGSFAITSNVDRSFAQRKFSPVSNAELKEAIQCKEYRNLQQSGIQPPRIYAYFPE